MIMMMLAINTWIDRSSLSPVPLDHHQRRLLMINLSSGNSGSRQKGNLIIVTGEVYVVRASGAECDCD